VYTDRRTRLESPVIADTIKMMVLSLIIHNVPSLTKTLKNAQDGQRWNSEIKLYKYYRDKKGREKKLKK
jgi:hypothetical protein